MTRAIDIDGKVPFLGSVAGTHAHRFILGAVVLGSLLLYAYTTARYGHTFVMVDGYLYYTHARSWYFDGDSDYENDLMAAPGLEVRDIYVNLRTPTGKVKNVHPCGWALVALPFVAVADAVTIAHNALLSTDVPRDGYSVYYMALVPLSHVLVGIAGLLAAYTVLSRYFPKSIAAAAVALVWIGTNVVYFVSIEPTMSHAASMGFVALTVWASDTIARRGWSLPRATALGACCGLMANMRYTNIVWVLVPLLLLGPSLAADLYHRGGGAVRRFGLAALAVGVAGLCLVPQILVNLTLEGAVIGSVAEFSPTAWLKPQFAVELFAGPTALFRLYPLVILCLIGAGILASRGRRPRLLVVLLVAFAAHLYLYASSYGEDAGYSRRYVRCLPLFAFGLAGMLQWARQGRHRTIVIGLLVGVLCAKNLAMLAMVDRGEISRKFINGGRFDLTGIVFAVDVEPRTLEAQPPTIPGATRCSLDIAQRSGNGMI